MDSIIKQLSISIQIWLRIKKRWERQANNKRITTWRCHVRTCRCKQGLRLNFDKCTLVSHSSAHSLLSLSNSSLHKSLQKPAFIGGNNSGLKVHINANDLITFHFSMSLTVAKSDPRRNLPHGKFILRDRHKPAPKYVMPPQVSSESALVPVSLNLRRFH